MQTTRTRAATTTTAESDLALQFSGETRQNETLSISSKAIRTVHRRVPEREYAMPCQAFHNANRCVNGPSLAVEPRRAGSNFPAAK